MNEIYLKGKGEYEPRPKNLDKALDQKHNWRKNKGKIRSGMRKAQRKKMLTPNRSLAKEIIDLYKITSEE